MVSTNDVTRLSDRIIRIQHQVGQSNSEFVDGMRFDGVAEINKAGHDPKIKVCIRYLNQVRYHVMVVSVVVDYATVQMG